MSYSGKAKFLSKLGRKHESPASPVPSPGKSRRQQANGREAEDVTNKLLKRIQIQDVEKAVSDHHQATLEAKNAELEEKLAALESANAEKDAAMIERDEQSQKQKADLESENLQLKATIAEQEETRTKEKVNHQNKINHLKAWIFDYGKKYDPFIKHISDLEKENASLKVENKSLQDELEVTLKGKGRKYYRTILPLKFGLSQPLPMPIAAEVFPRTP
jgi:chromosome segregation ATPase